jgi:preprotein translocase subunit SecD
MKGVQKVIENRVNASGTTEAVVSIAGKDRLLVEIPGKNPDVIKKRLLKTAKLEFRELGNDMTSWVNTGITGADLKRAQAIQDLQQGSGWLISFEMKPEGAIKFSELTGRLLKGTLPNGKQAYVADDKGNKILKQNMPLAVFLDDKMVSDPASVRGQISNNGQISGSFTQEEAVEFALQLNAGALPIPLKLLEERTVSSTLGEESLNKSLWAGIVGLSVIAFFMILIYRLPGLIAAIALIAYTLLSMGVFTKTVTLSSAGIAGFILSIGMAVDANILIFERIKEELKKDKGLARAIDEGFAKAFPSIFDSNLNTLIVCTILLIFGTGLVKGFAITLALGVLISFFSAIVITRELLALFQKMSIFNKPFFYGVNKW